MLRKTLDFEKQTGYSFRVLVTDGRRNDSARVNVTVLNINDWDPRFRYPQYEFHVKNEEDVARGHVVGRLDVFDGDKGDRTTLHLRGPHARLFDIDPNGDLVIADTR